LYLLENTRTTLPQKDFIAGLKTSVDDLSIAINNLLNFSVLVSDKVKVEEEEFKISDFLQSIKQAVQIKADNSNLELQFEIDKNLPDKLISDPKKITQILYNLMDNSIKFTKEGGSIKVKAGASDVQSNKMNLILSIEDTGRGMSRQQVRSLLESDNLLKVYTEEEEGNSFKKRQLGVAIVNKLAQTMGGEMEITSKEGIGSQFKLIIPVKIAKQTKILAKNAPEVPLKILLVEDHFLNQIATKKVLTTWSELVTVDIAENGLVSIEKFKELGYDLILMDIQMPVMNGIDAARRIREISDVPIIALTANSTKQEQDKCFETGMNDYLAKPFKPQELHAKIMSLISLVLN
jgi:CheY-like chemotaxis protein